MAKSTILFARILFETKLSQFEKKNELLEYRKEKLLKVIDFNTPIKKMLKDGGKLEHIKNFDWHFAGIKEGKNYIYGKLGKERGRTKLSLDSIKKDYVKDIIMEANIIYFLIDLEKNVLVYELKKDVGHTAPIEVIKDVFNLFYHDKEKIHIETITDKREIINRMKRFNYISNIKLTLYPTNPDSTSGSDEMDKFLQNGNIKRLCLEAFSNDEHLDKGIKIDKVPLIKSGFHLAEEGYGSAKASGKIGSTTEEIVTGDIPMKSETEIISDDTLNIKNLLKDIKIILERIEEKK